MLQAIFLHSIKDNDKFLLDLLGFIKIFYVIYGVLLSDLHKVLDKKRNRAYTVFPNK